MKWSNVALVVGVAILFACLALGAAGFYDAVRCN